MSDIYPWEHYPLHELEQKGIASLGRGNIISKIDIQNNPGGFPIYSSSAKGEGLFGAYGDYMFDEEMITWSVDGGGNLFYRPRHKFSVTNVSGYMRLDTSILDYRFAHAALALQHSKLTFDYQTKAHPSVIRNLYHLPIPPLPEQKKIAEILSGIDEQIANKTRKVEKHKHLLAGILNQLMTSGTTDQKVVETDAGRVPENWRVGKVEDFFDLGRGRVISIPHIKENPGPYPVFSSQSKNNGEMGRMNSYDFEGDYFTWTTDGAYAGSVFARSGKFNCTNVCGTGRAKSSSEADTRFAAYFLQRVAKRHVSYVGNPKLMNNVFAAIPFALPPIDEQREIIKVIDSTKIGIELLERQITSLSNLKSSIASDLLSGRKRVSV
jgi:type I restriction enzyme S subunit